MAQRTGLASVRSLGIALCKMITFATPIVNRVYPDNAALKAALAAAMAACEVLNEEITNTLPQGV